MKYKTEIRKIVSVLSMFALIFVITPAELFAEDSSTQIKDEWMMLDSYYNADENSFVLTEKKTWQRGSMWYNTPYLNDFQIELDYYTGDVQEYWGADGITVAFYADFNYEMINGQDMAFCGSNGYGIELDTFQNEDYEDPEYNHIALVKDRGNNHIGSEKLLESEDGKWHHLKIDVNSGTCTAYVDDQLKLTSKVEATGNGWIGITSATGNGVNEHKVRNIRITGDESEEKKLIDLEVTSKTISKNETSCDIEISATVTNGMDIKAKNSFVGLVLQEGLTLKDAEKDVIDLGEIDVEKKAEAKWTITCNLSEASQKYNYKVILIIDDIAKMEKNDYVWVPGTGAADNSIIMGKDQWSFDNTRNYFSDPIEQGYYMSREDYNKFTMYYDNISGYVVYKLVNVDGKLSKAVEPWGGSCYGMAATVILNKMGLIAPQNMVNVENLYDIKKKGQTNDEIESLINFYQVQQYLGSTIDDRFEFKGKDVEVKFGELSEQVKKVSAGGVPVMLDFYWNKLDKETHKKVIKDGRSVKCGHTVVAYDIETGKWKKQEGEYDTRVKIYDPNYPKWDFLNDNYLYYDSQTFEWEIPNYPGTYYPEGEAYIGWITNDIAKIDRINHPAVSADYESYLEVKRCSRFTLKNGEQTYQIDGLKGSNGIDIILGSVGYVDGVEPEISTIVKLPQASAKEFVIEPENSQTNVDYCWRFPNSMANITSSNASKITCNQNGEIALSGENSDYTLELVFNEECNALPWYATSVSGKNCNRAVLKQTKEGIVIYSDNLTDVTVITTGNNGDEKLNFGTDNGSALITNKTSADSKPCIKIDADNNGSYETTIKTGDSTGNTGGGGFPAFSVKAITAKYGLGGIISPNGISKISYGSSQTFTITPDSGYEIADVLVDDKSVGAVSTYTFENVQSDHTISATFKKKDKDSEAEVRNKKIKAAKAVKIKASSSQGINKKGKRYIKVKWTKKGADVSGYQVYRSFKKTKGFEKFYTTKNKYYYNTKALKKGKRHYYKVRAYTVIDGNKYYSKYSNLAYRTVRR